MFQSAIFSVMLKQSHRFLDFNQYSKGVNVSYLRTQQDAASLDRTQQLSIRSQMLYHYATMLTFLHFASHYITFMFS